MPSFKEAGFLGDDVAQFRVNVRAYASGQPILSWHFESITMLSS